MLNLRQFLNRQNELNKTNQNRKRWISRVKKKKTIRIRSWLFSHSCTYPFCKVLSENNKVTNDSTKEDDLIILGELTGYRTKRWRFPQTEHCPKTKCAKEFETRAEAINHYRTKHAKYDILCGICKKLISVSGAFNLTRHYLCKHPGNAIPKKLLQQNVCVEKFVAMNK